MIQTARDWSKSGLRVLSSLGVNSPQRSYYSHDSLAPVRLQVPPCGCCTHGHAPAAPPYIQPHRASAATRAQERREDPHSPTPGRLSLLAYPYLDLSETPALSPPFPPGVVLASPRSPPLPVATPEPSRHAVGGAPLSTRARFPPRAPPRSSHCTILSVKIIRFGSVTFVRGR